MRPGLGDAAGQRPHPGEGRAVGARARRARPCAESGRRREPGRRPTVGDAHGGGRERAGEAVAGAAPPRCRRGLRPAVHGRRGAGLPAPVQARGLRRRVRAGAGRRGALPRCRPHPRLGGASRPGSAPRTRRHKIVFSGDLGQPGRPLVADPDAGRRTRTPSSSSPPTATGCTRRSRRPTTNSRRCWRRRCRAATCVIPAFAVGRTQEVLHVLADLVRQRRAPTLTVFVDSPLATMATRDHRAIRGAAGPREPRGRALARAHRSGCACVHRDAAGLDGDQRDLARRRDRRRQRHVRGRADPAPPAAHLPRSRVRDRVHRLPGGRTLGRALVDGATRVRLFREDVPVRASVHTIGGLSAHGDRAALLGWLPGFTTPPARAFVVHGERDTAEGFADALRDELHFPSVTVPRPGRARSTSRDRGAAPSRFPEIHFHRDGNLRAAAGRRHDSSRVNEINRLTDPGGCGAVPRDNRRALQHRNGQFDPFDFHQAESLFKYMILMCFFMVRRGIPACHCNAAMLTLRRHEQSRRHLERDQQQQGLGIRNPIHARQTGRAILAGPCSGATAAGSAVAYRTAALPRAQSRRGTR